MIFDFTLKVYEALLKSLKNNEGNFITYSSFFKEVSRKAYILRHDVDRLPENSLRFAQIQHKLGITGSYYFRAVPESWDEQIIKDIASMGHEIGYHYESLTTCKGNMEAAIKDFESNLTKLRKLASVNTICMHGSPRSPYDSRDLWEKYNYRDFGIIGEPYFDIDFSKVLYLTDTGRRWDGDKVSVRDKAYSELQEKYRFKSTNQIIHALDKDDLPDQIMITTHPQRWTNKPLPWFKELVWQNMKNVVKRYLFVNS